MVQVATETIFTPDLKGTRKMICLQSWMSWYFDVCLATIYFVYLLILSYRSECFRLHVPAPHAYPVVFIFWNKFEFGLMFKSSIPRKFLKFYLSLWNSFGSLLCVLWLALSNTFSIWTSAWFHMASRSLFSEKSFIFFYKSRSRSQPCFGVVLKTIRSIFEFLFNFWGTQTPCRN